MALSRSSKTVLGVATVWPLAMFALYLLLMLAAVAYLAVAGPSSVSARVADVAAPVLIVLYTITMLDLLVLPIVYVCLVVVRFAGDLMQTAVWAAAVLFIGLPAYAVFYWLHVRPWLPRDEHSLSAEPTSSPESLKKGYFALRLLSLAPYAGVTALLTFAVVYIALEAPWRSDYGEALALVLTLSAAMLIVLLTAIAVPRLVLRGSLRRATDETEFEANLSALFVATALASTAVPLIGFNAAFMAEDWVLWLASVTAGVVPALLAWPTSARRAKWQRTLRASDSGFSHGDA